MATLFEKYGGFSNVSKIVMAFYDKVLDCEEVGHYFDNIDMRRQIDHQTKFVSALMGGPSSYSNEALQRVHRPLGINESEFNRVVYLMQETLNDFAVDPNDIDAIVGEMNARSSFIISKQGD